MLCAKQGLYLQLPSSRGHVEARMLKFSFSVEVEKREEMLIWLDFPLGMTQWLPVAAEHEPTLHADSCKLKGPWCVISSAICDSCGALNIKCGLAGEVSSLEKEFREKGKEVFYRFVKQWDYSVKWLLKKASNPGHSSSWNKWTTKGKEDKLTQIEPGSETFGLILRSSRAVFYLRS